MGNRFPHAETLSSSILSSEQKKRTAIFNAVLSFGGPGKFEGGLRVIGGQIVGSSMYSGGEIWASSYNLISDPNQKDNIVEQTQVNALQKLLNMKFYSYDIKDSSAHIKYGTMAPEAPTEIQTDDGKAIDLYAYINLTAKAVQELSAKVEQQEKEIAELKAAIAELKQ